MGSSEIMGWPGTRPLLARRNEVASRSRGTYHLFQRTLDAILP